MMEHMIDVVSFLTCLYVQVHMTFGNPGGSITEHEVVCPTLAVGDLASFRHDFGANTQPRPLHVRRVGVAFVRMRTIDIFVMLWWSKNAKEEYAIAFEIPKKGAFLFGF